MHLISNIRAYKFYRWHSGFNYFVGQYNGKKIFIKVCCGKWNTISTEAHLQEKQDFKIHPTIISYEIGEISWIATEFCNFKPLNKYHESCDINALIESGACTLDELWKNGIVHRDLRPENIGIGKKNEIILIDFGWAVYNDLNYAKTDYIFIESILNIDYRDGEKFDDALSMYFAFKQTFPQLTDEELQPIKSRIGRLSV